MSQKRYNMWKCDENVKKPKSTYYLHLKKEKERLLREQQFQSSDNNNPIQLLISEEIELTENNLSVESSELNHNSLLNTIQTFVSNESTESEVTNCRILYETSSDYVNSVINDEESNEIYDIIESNKETITKDELAVAFLAAFFDCKIPQKAFSNFLKLSNITSSIKLPTDFTGLRNLLFTKEQVENLKPSKSWFCYVCYKSYEKLSDRTERLCPECSAR